MRRPSGSRTSCGRAYGTRALANENRFSVWDQLRDHEATVSDLSAHLALSQQTVSASLHELLRVGLVERRRDGNRTRYRLADPTMEHSLAAQRLSIERRALAVTTRMQTRSQP